MLISGNTTWSYWLYLDSAIDEVPELDQKFNWQNNSSPNYFFGVLGREVIEGVAFSLANGCESESSERTGNLEIGPSKAQRFRDVVRIFYCWIGGHF